MKNQFYTILTDIGKAKIANSTALGTKVNLVKFQVGDGGGSYYDPVEDQTSLKNKTWEGNIGSIGIDESNPNWIIIETVIPGSDGGFTVREAGVFDADGDMIAVGKFPETYKPVVGDGSLKDLILKMILEISNTDSVNLKLDPTVILATKKDILELDKKINSIELTAIKISIVDTSNLFESTNVEDALKEVMLKVSKNSSELDGQRLRGISIANSLLSKV